MRLGLSSVRASRFSEGSFLPKYQSAEDVTSPARAWPCAVSPPFTIDTDGHIVGDDELVSVLIWMRDHGWSGLVSEFCQKNGVVLPRPERNQRAGGAP